MKRIYLCILSFTIVLSAMAGSGKFIIISGDKGVLSEVANAQLEIDYSNTSWEGESYKSFCGADYQERVERARDGFIFAFNSKEGLHISDDGSKYKMDVKVEKFLRKIRSFYRGEVMVWCTINVTNIQTGQNVLKLQVIRSGGESDYAITDGIRKCFTALAERLKKQKFKMKN